MNTSQHQAQILFTKEIFIQLMPLIVSHLKNGQFKLELEQKQLAKMPML